MSKVCLEPILYRRASSTSVVASQLLLELIYHSLYTI